MALNGLFCRALLDRRAGPAVVRSGKVEDDAVGPAELDFRVAAGRRSVLAVDAVETHVLELLHPRPGIVDDNAEVVRGHAVRAQDHEVIEFAVGDDGVKPDVWYTLKNGAFVEVA